MALSDEEIQQLGDSGYTTDQIYAMDQASSGIDVWDTSNPSTPQPVIITPTPVPPSSTGAWATTLINDGMKVLNSALAYSMLQNQINRGQPTTIGYDPLTGQPTGQSAAGILAALKSGQIASALSTSAWLYIIIGAVVLIMVMRK